MTELSDWAMLPLFMNLLTDKSGRAVQATSRIVALRLALLVGSAFVHIGHCAEVHAELSMVGSAQTLGPHNLTCTAVQSRHCL